MWYHAYGFADFALGIFEIGATKPIFLDSGFPRGEGVVCAWAWFVIIV